MLQLFVFPQIDDIEKEKVEILFQLNGAPPHFNHEVRNGLNLRFPNPDTSPLFFFFLLGFKSFVDTEKTRHLNNFERINTSSSANASRNMKRHCVPYRHPRYLQGYKWFLHWALLRYYESLIYLWQPYSKSRLYLCRLIKVIMPQILVYHFRWLCILIHVITVTLWAHFNVVITIIDNT